MLVLDYVACNAEAQAGALSDRFGGEEVLEEVLLHLVGHALTVVGNGDGQVAAGQYCADGDSGSIGGLVF